MLDPQVLAFTAIVALLTISPGADTMLVVRNVLARGRIAGMLTTLGIGSGLFIHATLSALGLSMILMRSALAFEALRYLGAAYLIYLGIRAILQAPHSNQVESAITPDSHPGAPVLDRWQSMAEGLLTNVLNPKVAIFYLAFLPQFIRPSEAPFGKSILLAGIHFVLSLAWLTFISLSAAWASGMLTRPVVRKKLEWVTGSVLILFGLKLAFVNG